MKTRIIYEWDYETVDEHRDIVDHNHRERLADFYPNEKTDQLVLVRDEADEAGLFVDRSWAYVDAGQLPENFTNAADRPVAKVPQRFHKELNAYLNPAVSR